MITCYGNQHSQHTPQLFAIVQPTLYKQIHFYTPLLMIYLIMNFKAANFLKTDCAYRKTAPHIETKRVPFPHEQTSMKTAGLE